MHGKALEAVRVAVEHTSTRGTDPQALLAVDLNFAQVYSDFQWIGVKSVIGKATQYVRSADPEIVVGVDGGGIGYYCLR